MANPAGIELILTAPQVKSIMDEVIEDWKEIAEREKEAKKFADEYSMAVTLQLAKMKQMSLENQNIKNAIAGLKNPIEETTQKISEQVVEVEKVATVQRKSILGTIRDYIAQRSELKRVKDAILSVKNEIHDLDLKQRELGRSASLSAEKYKEFEANKVKLDKLGQTLKNLQKDHKNLDANIKGTERQYAGLLKTLGVIGKATAFVVTAIGLVFAAAIVGVAKLVSDNDRVQEAFKKVQTSAKKVKDELINALAPIGTTIADLIGKGLDSIAGFLEENQDAIFQWAAKAAGYIAGFVEGTIQAFKNAALIVKEQIAFFKLDFELLKAVTSSGVTLISPKGRKDLQDARDAAKAATQAVKEAKSGYEVFTEVSTRVTAGVIALGKAHYDTANLTDAQLAAIKKLNEEYETMLANLKRLEEEQLIKDAGPFGGIIVKAEIAAKQLEAARDRFIAVGKQLNKSQKDLNDITLSYNKLIESVRSAAIKTLFDQADESLDKLIKKVDELKAKSIDNETGLKFKIDLELQLTELEESNKRLLTVIENSQKEIDKAIAEGRKPNEKVISEKFAAIEKIALAASKALELGQLTVHEHFKNQAEQFLNEAKIQIDKQYNFILNRQAELQRNLELNSSLIIPNQEARNKILLDIEVNDFELKVFKESLNQIEDSISNFKEFGIFLVVETPEQIKKKLKPIEDEIAALADRLEKEGNLNLSIKPKKGKFFDIPAIEDEFQNLNDVIEHVFGAAAGDILRRYGGAFEFLKDQITSSIDAQIEAIDALVERRRDSVDQLEEDIQIEAEFKLAGLANDYQLYKDDLEQRRQLLAQAEAKQEELNKKKVKQQQAADTLLQASSLATSVANMFKGITATLNPGAFLVAIVASGVLLAAFAAAKLKAAKLARAYKGSRRVADTYGMLAPGENENDAPGHDRGLSVVDRHGRLRGFLGGDEQVNKESVSRRHRAALQYLNENEGKFQNVNLLNHLKALEHLERNPINYTRITEKNEQLREKIIIIERKQTISKKDMKEAVKEAVELALREQTRAMIDYHESRPDIIPNEWLKNYTEKNSRSTKIHKSK